MKEREESNEGGSQSEGTVVIRQVHHTGGNWKRENTSWHTIIGRQVAITTNKENPVKNDLVGGKVLWRSWGANGGHLAEQSRRESSLSVTVLGGLWYGRMFASDNSGLEGGRTLPCFCLAVTQKGEFTTVSLSVTAGAAPKGEARKARRPDLDLSPGKGCLYFKVIFQLNTTEEVKLTEMEITYR